VKKKKEHRVLRRAEGKRKGGKMTEPRGKEVAEWDQKDEMGCTEETLVRVARKKLTHGRREKTAWAGRYRADRS